MGKDGRPVAAGPRECFGGTLAVHEAGIAHHNRDGLSKWS